MENQDAVFLVVLTTGCTAVAWLLLRLVGEEIAAGLGLVLWLVGFSAYHRQ